MSSLSGKAISQYWRIFAAMTFELPVTEQRVKPHQVTALHLLCAMAFIGTGSLFYRYFLAYKEAGAALAILGLALVLTAIVKNRWLRTKKVNIAVRSIELAVLAALGIFTAIQGWSVPTGMFAVLAVAVLFGLYWENGAESVLVIRIDDSGIKLPITSRRRSIDWTEVEQVLFRHGTLTIDCHNQRLFQWIIGPAQIDARQLESYSSEQVEAHRSKRVSDDW